jgi:transposase
MTPSASEQKAPLFPSLLVACIEGKSKGARRRARRRGRAVSWNLVEIMWAYFTFLEGGSPFKRLDQQRLLDRAVCTPWTSSHAAYAGYMHDEINT